MRLINLIGDRFSEVSVKPMGGIKKLAKSELMPD